MSAWPPDTTAARRAERTVTHVRRLLAAGWRRQDLADEAGVSTATVHAYADGAVQWGQAASCERLLAVDGPPPDRTATGRRRSVSDADVDTAWRTWAACTPGRSLLHPRQIAEIFFPERGESTAPARALCADCPAKKGCLDYAVATGEKHGIWGGRSERERRRMRNGRVPATPIDRAPERGLVVLERLRAEAADLYDDERFAEPAPVVALRDDGLRCPVCLGPSDGDPCSADCDTRAWARRLLGEPISDLDHPVPA